MSNLERMRRAAANGREPRARPAGKPLPWFKRKIRKRLPNGSVIKAFLKRSSRPLAPINERLKCRVRRELPIGSKLSLTYIARDEKCGLWTGKLTTPKHGDCPTDFEAIAGSLHAVVGKLTDKFCQATRGGKTLKNGRMWSLCLEIPILGNYHAVGPSFFSAACKADEFYRKSAQRHRERAEQKAKKERIAKLQAESPNGK